MHDPRFGSASVGERAAGGERHPARLDRCVAERERQLARPDRYAPLGFHVVMRLADDRPIATSRAARRVLARVVLGQGERCGLLAFGAADDHLHAELATDRASAGAFAHHVEVALGFRLALGARFERVRIRPLVDQRHAYNTFGYVSRQDSRHDVGLDPEREATAIHDLLGLRVLYPRIRARVRSHLPRIGRDDLLKHLPRGVFDEAIPIALDLLADAAAAAFALPDLLGRSLDAARARRAAIQSVPRDVPSEQLAGELGVGVRLVQAARAAPLDGDAVRAIQAQARLRAVMRDPSFASAQSESSERRDACAP